VNDVFPVPAPQASLASPRRVKLASLRDLAPFFRPYRPQITAAAIFLTLSSITTLVLPLALRILIDRGFVPSVPSDPGARVMALREHFLGFFGVAAAFALFAGARFYSVSWIGERVTADLRKALYSHVIAQSPAFFEREKGGEVLSRLTADTTLVQTVASTSLSMGLRSLVTSIGALLMLTLTNLTVSAHVWTALIPALLPLLVLGRRLRKLSRESQDRIADATAVASEVLGAMTVVQSYVQEKREAARFDAATERAVSSGLRRTRLRSISVTVMIVTISGALLWSLFRGTEAVLRGELTAGQLGETVVYTIILVNSVALLAEVFGDFSRAAGATERLMELLATRSEIVSPENPLPLPEVRGGSTLELEDVTFHYPARPDQPALSHVSLRIEAGQTVALVGPSGAGKSTVFQLLLRFYDVERGELRLDGVPLPRASLAELRGRIAMVPQDSVIFSADALENIRYGCPDADDTRVIEAAKAAHAHEFIDRLPDGYKTFLGERGVRLSGGQRQRISIARAILKDPSLLLLDEATSALDTESERMVQAAIERVMRGRTTVVIAHRLSTVQRADRIVVMDGGEIVDSGSHRELIARGGLYARLAMLQFDQAGDPPERQERELTPN
jgi:ATP-binding cassette, subfamily B, bacterial